ncbi:DNRLRE domain-containing protein [Micromonospora sp. CPCC 205371]|nr:DNRLRE domain-containing protein [Micromonospora sp. CPCC 205371]
MRTSIRLIAAGLVLAVVVPLGAAPDRTGRPDPAGGAGGLPVGGSTTAPRQASGSADGLGPPGNTDTALGSPARKAVRPKGAVADKATLPVVRGREPAPPAKLTDVTLRQQAPAKGGFDARTSKEDTGRRTATSRLYRNADGTNTLRLYEQPVQVREPDGSWAPVDLELAAEAGGRLAPRVGPHEVTFAGETTGADLARLDLDADHAVALGLRGADRVRAGVAGARTTYTKPLPDTDVVLTATATGWKEDLVLRSAAAPAVYEFDLNVRGLTPTLDRATGDIGLSDRDGKVRAVIPAGWMRDADGAESRDVRYRLSGSGGSWVLRVELDKDWLGDPRRAYPVTVDPSVWVNADLDDTYVTSGSTANRSGELQLKVGKEAGGGISASYLHFSRLAADLRNQYINGASLVLYNVDSPSCTAKPVDVYAVGQAWSGSTMRTWPGAPLGQHLAQESFAYGRTACPAAYVGFGLPADVVTDWTHGAPFHGLSVRAANEGDTGAFKRFASADAGGSAAPYLDVTYAPHGAAYHVDEVILPTAGPEGRLKATVRNRGSQTWPARGQHKFGYIVKQGATVVQTSPKFDLPHDVAPNASVAMDIPMASLTPGDYDVYLTMYDGAADYQPTYGVPYGVFGMTVENVPPSVEKEQPGNGAIVDSLTPTLYAQAKDADNWPNKGFQYNFKLCEGPHDAPVGCVESGWTGATWIPPVGKLRWSKTYHWWVQAHDTVNAGPFAGPLALSPRVPQPQITAHLGGTPQGAPAEGLDPQVGNFGMVATDASVATAGPELTLARTYNSLDPRPTNAFGEGWASRLDTELTQDSDGSGNVVVTLPSGRQVRFGQNIDLTFAPPPGQNLTLTYATSTAQYTLRDATGSRWIFHPCGKLHRVVDPAGLVAELEYASACPDGKPTGVRNLTSGRKLHLTWTGGHVTEVRTDPPAAGSPGLAWTYGYDGDRLVRACNPAPAPNCTRYEYTGGSHYRSVVLDDNPRAYYRLGETNSAGGAASATARSPGADKGTYDGVTLGSTGPLAGTDDTAGTFNGAASRIDLPSGLISPTMTLAVEMWFKAAPGGGGVLLSYASKPFAPGATADVPHTPVLYVGQDGHLRGGFWVPAPEGPRQIVTPAPVNDDKWHHVVLSASVDSQTLYLDGVALPEKIRGLIDHDEMPHLAVGTGSTAHWPSGNDADYYFTGSLDEVAVYQHPLGATAAAQHHAAARQAEQLTKITLPQDDRVAATLTYDDVNDRVATYVDHQGRTWRLENPTRAEATRRVVLHGPYPDTIYEFDADAGGRLTKRTYDGGTRLYRYNEAGFRSEEVDELGHTAKFTTDARGNVLSRTTCRAPDSCQTSYSTYFLNADNPLDPRNDRVLTQSDARATGPDDARYRTNYQYDTAGRLISATYPKPAGVTTAPTERWVYASGLEAADGGGTVPAALLIEHTGKRSGQVTSYKYRSTGDLAEQVAPTGLRTRHTYDGIGRLAAKTPMTASGQAFGTTTYTYTPRSEVETVTEPAVTNPVSGVRHTLVTQYRYDANGNRVEMTLRDTTGGDPPRTTTYGYDAHDTLVSTTHPDGGKEEREYRDAGLEERVTDPEGTTWITNFDSRGRTLRRVASGPRVDPQDPNATALALESHTYDAAGRLAASRDAMGRETRYTYYDDDRLATATRVGVLQADGRTRRDIELERNEYDPAGNITRRTTAGGRVTTTTYDPAGNPAAETLDPGGLARTTTYTRDPDGAAASVSRTGAAQSSRVEATRYGYDAAGALIREDVQPVADDPGSVYSITYRRDERGLVLERTDRRRLPTTYTYDAMGRQTTITGPAVDTWVAGQRQTGVHPQRTVGYNAFGEPTHDRDPNGALTVTGYDTMGRGTSVRLPDYTPPGGQRIEAVTRTEYDKLGNPRVTIDALDRRTTRTYDPYGRVLTETLPQIADRPSTTTYQYDRNGEVVSTTDPTGATRLATYDELGRTVTTSAVERLPQPSYFITRYAYDDAGNPVSVTTPAGHTTTTTFNAAGEPVTVTDPTSKVTSYRYDLAGRQTHVTDPAGVTTRTTYDLLGQPVTVAHDAGDPLIERRRALRAFDPNGNVTQITSPEGRVTTYAYDAADRVVRQDEKVDATTTVSTVFGYDAAGNRTRLVDGNGNATTYTYTSWGAPESTVEPATATTPAAADRTWTTTYDALGNAVGQTAPGGVTTSATYDAQNRLRAQSGAGAEAPTASKSYGYDAAGRLTSFGGPGGDTVLTYDDRGNLSSIRGPAGEATLGYTADSQLASRADAAGTSTFAYDPAGRLLSIVDGLAGRTIDHTYDPATGRLAYTAERGLQASVRRVNTYDVLGRLTGDKVTELDPNGGGSRVIYGTEYGYDRDDKITSKKTIANGVETANAYGYDGASRLVSWTSPTGTTTYGWDGAGNRVRAGSATFAYDERNRLLSGDGRSYTYTARGTLASIAGTGVPREPKFDAFDQLISDDANYAYDSLGRVASRNGTGFAYGSLGNDVVSDGTRLINRGPAGEPLSDKPIGTTETAKLLYTDLHDDVVARHRAASTYGQRAYDPFGTVTASSGAQSSVGYQGEWTDPVTGAVNMHSRWYTPGTGTFTSRDTWTVPPVTAAAANRHAYANANPMAHTDPSGHVPFVIPVIPLIPAIGSALWAAAGAIAAAVAAAALIASGLVDKAADWTVERWKDLTTERVAGQARADPKALARLAAQATARALARAISNAIARAAGAAVIAALQVALAQAKSYAAGGTITGPGGGKGGGAGSPAPPPPPPPQWLLNIANAGPRHAAGTINTARPATVAAATAQTEVYSQAEDLSIKGTKVTEVIGREFLDDVLAPGQSDDVDEDQEDCLSGDGPTYTSYWMLDDLGRATGVDACLDENDLTDVGAGNTFPYKATAPVAGYVEGTHDKGHLLGAWAGGLGITSENLVPLYPAANRKGMYHDFERCVRDRILAGERIHLTVVPIYEGDALVPTAVVMHAMGDQGYQRSFKIMNQPYYQPRGRKYCS